MRILHLSSEYPPQKIFGLGRYVAELSRELVRQKHEVHVLTNSMGSNADSDIIDQGVYVHRVNYPPPPKPLGQVAPVLTFNLHIQEKASELGFAGLGNPEVIISHDWLTAVGGERLARRFGVPHVWTVHDTVHGKHFGQIQEPDEQNIFQLECWAAKNARLVLANSKAVRKELIVEYGSDKKKTELLHCGVNQADFSSDQSAERVVEFRRQFAKPDEVLLTYVGRLDLEKGIDTLVNAFSLLKEQNKNVKLAIVGEGRLRETITGHIEKLGLTDSVRLYGYLQGIVLKHFYRVSDIHVCPSVYEPFGLVAVEAMASGTVVVASNTGGLREIINSPSVGRSVPIRDHEALAETLLNLVNDRQLREQLGKAGMRHIKNKFSWVRIARQAVAYYAQATN